ncbi:diacylglycerol/lipid kinase family protein [Sphingomonas sp. Leaf33]|uniref:diacylglycerol/lipid kinase family protein n=1 Tax=Sphingomonas sp. Leaf33 TaxID=1736215 RepID=UPI000AD7FAAC|nr:diacylglycerol kinase family protein [Sphingomonas sp. Leaf33]
MKPSIYDSLALPRLAFAAPDAASPRGLVGRTHRSGTTPRLVGLIRNPRSRRNVGSNHGLQFRPNVIAESPTTREALRDALAMFARRGIDLLVIDGGDGTIRDVLTCAGDSFGAQWPDVAILPSGKTNALGIDLGLPADWTLDDAMAAAVGGRTVLRSPVEIVDREAARPRVRGFLFGAGGFVDATELAQHTHRAGAFNGLAVGLALAGAIGSTLFGRADNRWRRGSRIALRYSNDARALHGATTASDTARYMMLASTLERLPVGLKPFGRKRPGLKSLVVDAPPRGLATSVPFLLAGHEGAWLETRGYHRIDASAFDVDVSAGFILDGEIFPGGAYRVSQGVPLRFVVS